MSFNSEKWKKIGKTPDYRFSLANERTFLAWIRTALALLAGAIAIEQLLHDTAQPWVKTILALFLASAGGITSIMALYRWRQNEIAMRKDEPLQYTSFLTMMTLFIVAIALISFLYILL
ncbi:putative membrane protein [Providencia alcalifaciens]|nr:putative membrane protein [Providencia alcalifaciens]